MVVQLISLLKDYNKMVISGFVYC